MIRYGIIILAAGESSRLGRPKQLLPFHDKSLLKNIVDAALALNPSITIVVTGAEKNAIEQELEGTGVFICYNAEWRKGLSSSIQKGINEIKKLHPEIEACILTVCDQPYVTPTILESLINKHIQTGTGIIASSYAGIAGTPVLFTHTYFDELMNLKGQEGAKKLLKIYPGDVALVPFDKGEIDIDTPDDYSGLIEKS